jgi:outer membrane protein assembly factor BamB
MEHPRVWSETVVIQIQQLNSGKRFVAGLDASSGQLKWQHAGLSNIELFEDQILALNYDGILTKLNADTGAIFNTTDLSTSFREQEMHCEHRFLATKSHLYFKHGITGKVGILNLTDMQLDVIQLPPGNTMATSEVPVPIDNRLYVRSAPQNNLFVYESLSHN